MITSNKLELQTFKGEIENTHLITCNGNDITTLRGYDEPDTAEAYAKEIVKRFNMHNEAMDIILGLVRESKSGDTEIVKMAIGLLNRDKE